MISTSALIDKFKYALENDWGYIYGTAGVKWTADRQAELEKTTDNDHAQGRLYGKKWIGHMVADCSGLFKWAFKELGGEMYHGSNTMYLKWCVDKGQLSKGKRSDGKSLKPGTAVFVWNGSTYSHVGLYIGSETVIEAQGTRNGVITTKVSATKWTYWGELKGVDYGTAAKEEPVYPTLRKGSKGDAVVELQNKLVKLGYYLGPYGVDGDFGKNTEKAVKEFQEDHGLQQDGVVGKKTWNALLAATEKKPSTTKFYTIHIPMMTEYQADAMIRQYPGAYKTEDKED